MNNFEVSEQSALASLLNVARELVKTYATPEDQEAALQALLSLALEEANA